MSQFTDRDGRTWSLGVTVGDLKPLREFGFDLNKIVGAGSGLGEILFAEPERLVGVLYHLCEKQAEKAGVTPEAFACLFDGPTIEAAGEALLEAVIDFSPRSRVARELKGRLKATLAAMDEELASRISSAPPAS